MRFENHDRLSAEIHWLARQPLPISLQRWNEFLDALEEALRDEYATGIESAPALAAREKVLEEC